MVFPTSTGYWEAYLRPVKKGGRSYAYTFRDRKQKLVTERWEQQKKRNDDISKAVDSNVGRPVPSRTLEGRAKSSCERRQDAVTRGKGEKKKE